ncbi:hypothetical protein DSECCO2_529960 [anaerobic digester metagenome]
MGAPAAGTATRTAGNHVGSGRQHCPTAFAVIGRLSAGTATKRRIPVDNWDP